MPFIRLQPLFISTLLFASTSFADDDDKPKALTIHVEAAEAYEDTLRVSVSTVGNLRSDEAVIIRPEVAGRVEKIHFEEGSIAEEGAPLISIDDREYQAELKRAEANLELARLNYNRSKGLAGTGSASRSSLDQATANLRVAEADLDLARTRLDNTKIKAPFHGIVGLRQVSPGSYVTIGQELVNFQNCDPMKVDFSVPETSAGLLKTGQEIEIRVDAIPGKTFRGKVYAIDPQLDVNGRSLALRAAIPNPDFELKSGYFARVELIVEEKAGALMIPEEALLPAGNQYSVYKIVDGKAVKQQVKTGLYRRGEVEITDGLNAGDIVVTAGQLKIRDGVAVDYEALEDKKSQGEDISKDEART